MNAAGDVAQALREAGVDDVDDSTLTRAMYSSDASLYRVPPQVVVRPRDVDEVLATVEVCRATATPLTLRGAGTSIAGNAVGPGVVLGRSTWRPTRRACSTRPTAGACDRGRTTASAACPHGSRPPHGRRGWPTRHSPRGCRQRLAAASPGWTRGARCHCWPLRRSGAGRGADQRAAGHLWCCWPTRSPTTSPAHRPGGRGGPRGRRLPRRGAAGAAVLRADAHLHRTAGRRPRPATPHGRRAGRARENGNSAGGTGAFVHGGAAQRRPPPAA